MRIIEIMYSLSAGGAERFIADISNELSKDNNNEVFLVTIVDDTIGNNKHYFNDLSPKIKYKCLGCKHGLSLESIVETYKIIKSLKPDIVHMHCNTMLLYIPSLIYKKTKYVYTFHNLVNKCYKFKFQKYINYFYLKRNCFQPVTISKLCQQSYIEFYHLNNSVCITNGRSRPSLTNEVNNTKKIINSFKTHTDDKIFLHVARCAPQKNQKLLFDTFIKLSKENKHFQLIIIGAGYEDSPYYQKLKDNPAFHFMGVKQNIGDYLASADFFVLSSIYEGLPLSLLEAISIGCIPISTPVGGVPDVITNGVNGILSKSISEEDFYTAIVQAINHPSQINPNNVIKSYEARFSMTNCAKSYMMLFEKLINK